MLGTDSDAYPGISVLEMMVEAKNYNHYLASLIDVYLQPNFRVLDFGAGTGTFALPLLRRGVEVTCVETDATLGTRLRDAGATVVVGLDDIADESMDLIYTLNVLEHISDDAATVRALSTKLKSGGTLLVYVPAFEILYSRFDAEIGHLRRYRRGALTKTIAAAGFQITESRYADSVGFLTALLFRVFGHSGSVSRGAVKFYDMAVYPLSIVVDKLLRGCIGKNVIVVATKNVGAPMLLRRNDDAMENAFKTGPRHLNIARRIAALLGFS
jgi:SAM-dependent methyltransferase